MYLVIVLAVIGAVAVLLALIDSLWSVLELVSSYLMPYFLPAEVQPLSKKFGPWAAVTGSTDGIGKQYALELAKRGLNIVLISRNPDKLQAVAAEIEKLHSVKTKAVVADFSKGAEVYQHIEDEFKDIPVGLLVNNVGTQYEYPCYLLELPSSKAWELINVNVGAVTMMSKLVLKGMLERGGGAIVNVASGSELMPLPLMTVYAATKAYVRSFTLALREEYAPKNIYVQHVAPLFVSTKMNSFSDRLLEGSIVVPDATSYVRYAVATLGRVSSTSGYWTHGIQTTFIKLAPEWIRIKIGKHMNKQFHSEYLQMQSAKLKAK